MEDEFAEAIKGRGDDFKFYQDQYGEHPDDRAIKNEEITEKLADVQTLTNIFGGLKAKVMGIRIVSLQSLLLIPPFITEITICIDHMFLAYFFFLRSIR